MKLLIAKNSIIETQVDTIISQANPQLQRGGGLSGIIQEAAGDELFQFSKKWKKGK